MNDDIVMRSVEFCEECGRETRHTVKELPPTDAIMKVNGDNPTLYTCEECFREHEEL